VDTLRSSLQSRRGKISVRRPFSADLNYLTTASVNFWQSEMVHPRHFLVLLVMLAFLFSDGAAQQRIQRASITVDATKTAGPISPLLYGHFLEFMFEGVKSGLHAELLKNRSFDEQPNAIGLPRSWDRYPDDRNDDYALNFQWDDKHSYPERTDSEIKPHSLLVKVGEGVISRHGFFQSRIPLRAGLDYLGSVWLRTSDYEGRVSLALEQDTSSGRRGVASLRV
jgi:hypothetical protein